MGMIRKGLVGSPRSSKSSPSKKMTSVGRQNFFEILYFLRYSTEMMFILNVFMFVNRCTDKNSRKKKMIDGEKDDRWGAPQAREIKERSQCT